MGSSALTRPKGCCQRRSKMRSHSRDGEGEQIPQGPRGRHYSVKNTKKSAMGDARASTARVTPSMSSAIVATCPNRLSPHRH